MNFVPVEGMEETEGYRRVDIQAKLMPVKRETECGLRVE
jgi:hypothetical protein